MPDLKLSSAKRSVVISVPTASTAEPTNRLILDLLGNVDKADGQLGFSMIDYGPVPKNDVPVRAPASALGDDGLTGLDLVLADENTMVFRLVDINRRSWVQYTTLSYDSAGEWQKPRFAYRVDSRWYQEEVEMIESIMTSLLVLKRELRITSVKLAWS